MADENRDRDNDREKLEGKGGATPRNQPAGDEKEDRSQGEQDDVAEDRNLSGSSTWLNLPDQPEGESSDNDESSR